MYINLLKGDHTTSKKPIVKEKKKVLNYEWQKITCFVFVSTGGIVNVMPLLFSQISHNKTQVNLIQDCICHEQVICGVILCSSTVH